MAERDFETLLAAEGSALTLDERVAFAQQLALAPGVAAKRALVGRRLAPNSPEFAYHEALLALLEVDALLEHSQFEDARALLERQKPQSAEAERVLLAAGCSRRLKRVQQRRLMVELDVLHGLGATSEQIKVDALCLAGY